MPTRLVSYCNARFAALAGGPSNLVAEPLKGRFSTNSQEAFTSLLEQARAAAVRGHLELTSDDVLVPVQLSLSPAEIDGVVVICAVMTDLTEHKRNEKAYNRMREELVARERSMSVASHELGQPLSALGFVVSALSEQLRRPRLPSADVLLRQVDRIGKSVGVLSSLVGTLLDLAYIQAGRLELSLEEVDLAVIAAATIERFEVDLRRTGSTVQLDAQSVRGRWDRMRLEQAVGNLLSNAIKYGSGGIVHVSVMADEQLARLSVEDHGVGISREAQERIFKPYERATEE